MFKRWRIVRRLRKAAKAWDFCNSLILGLIDSSMNPEHESFAWSQLVWQEIVMWIQMDKQVSVEDFDCICQRRGFDTTKEHFLRGMLVHIGLGQKLCEEPVKCKQI